MPNEKLKNFMMSKQNPNFAVFQQFEELKQKAEKMIETEIEKAIVKLEKALEGDSLFNGLAPMKKIAQKIAKETAQEEISSFKKETNDNVKEVLMEFREKKDEIVEALKEKIEEIKNDFLEEKGKLVSSAEKELKEIENDAKNKIEYAINNIPTVQGEKGEKGDDGYTPVKGKDYFNGENGKDGKDGSPDKPEQIAEKLNKTEQSISLKVIRGLENELKTLRQNISGGKKGGGGMGNVQHETFSISAGTATITTAFPIAGNGKAIFTFTYENARLEMTNHYTVGTDNKTITFHADIQSQFVNNTVAAITYIRG